MSSTAHPPHEASAWLRETVTQALLAVLEDPDAQACDHPALRRCLTLHDRRLRCAHCAAAYSVALRTLDPAEDHTCDRCRQLIPTLTPVVLDLGPLLVALGLCPACLAHEGGPSHAAR